MLTDNWKYLRATNINFLYAGFSGVKVDECYELPASNTIRQLCAEPVGKMSGKMHKKQRDILLQRTIGGGNMKT
jgi:hypothetical protein